MGDSLKLVPAGVYLFLLLFLHVVEPVLFMQELFAAHVAPYGAYFVRLLGVLYELVVAPEPRVAFVALGLLAVEEAHKDHAKGWLLSWIIKSKKKNSGAD
jgi:hypothetical protein